MSHHFLAVYLLLLSGTLPHGYGNEMHFLIRRTSENTPSTHLSEYVPLGL